MSNYKVSKFIQSEFDRIIKDSREYRAFELGVAYGNFGLFKYVKSNMDEEKAKEIFKDCINGKDRISEYFNKLIELDKEQNTETEELIEKLNKHYDKPQS